VPAVAFTLAVHFVFPLIGSWYAFTDWNGIGKARFIGLGNFREILRTDATRGALYHTLELAACFVVSVNFIGLALALGLNHAIKSRHFLRSLFFLPVVVSPIAVAFVWRYIFDYYGPLNKTLDAIGLGAWKHPWLADPSWALWTILLVLLWEFSGLTMILYLAGLQTIPDELYEASSVDGATTWTRFRRITLPLLAPAFTVAWTLTLIFGLRLFDQVLGLTGGGPGVATETLATQMWKQTWVLGRFGYGAALGLTLASLIAVLAVSQLLLLRMRESRL